jgi:hypothetical protein
MNRVVVLRTVVTTRKIIKRNVAPAAYKFVRNVVISTAADTIVHHKIPDMIDLVNVSLWCSVLENSLLL